MIVTCGAQRFVGVGLLRDQKANAHLACRRGVAAPLGGKRFCPVWTPLYGLNAEGTRVAVRTQSTIVSMPWGTASNQYKLSYVTWVLVTAAFIGRQAFAQTDHV